MNPFKVKGRLDFKKLILSLLISEGVGVLSYLFTMNVMEKYKQLNQPSFAPPSWIFSVVWPILFFLMGLAFYRVWMYGTKMEDVKSAMFYYGSQLVFNFLWTILFFRLNLRGLALLDLIILLIFIIITTVKFFRIDKLSGYLMLPYIAWVVFAGFLNYSVWQLNK